jgi:hypothetical protein
MLPLRPRVGKICRWPQRSFHAPMNRDVERPYGLHAPLIKSMLLLQSALGLALWIHC